MKLEIEAGHPMPPFNTQSSVLYSPLLKSFHFGKNSEHIASLH